MIFFEIRKKEDFKQRKRKEEGIRENAKQLIGYVESEISTYINKAEDSTIEFVESTNYSVEVYFKYKINSTLDRLLTPFGTFADKESLDILIEEFGEAGYRFAKFENDPAMQRFKIFACV